MHITRASSNLRYRLRRGLPKTTLLFITVAEFILRDPSCERWGYGLKKQKQEI